MWLGPGRYSSNSNVKGNIPFGLPSQTATLTETLRNVLKRVAMQGLQACVIKLGFRDPHSFWAVYFNSVQHRFM